MSFAGKFVFFHTRILYVSNFCGYRNYLYAQRNWKKTICQETKNRWLKSLTVWILFICMNIQSCQVQHIQMDDWVVLTLFCWHFKMGTVMAYMSICNGKMSTLQNRVMYLHPCTEREVSTKLIKLSSETISNRIVEACYGWEGIYIVSHCFQALVILIG